MLKSKGREDISIGLHIYLLKIYVYKKKKIYVKPMQGSRIYVLIQTANWYEAEIVAKGH